MRDERASVIVADDPVADPGVVLGYRSGRPAAAKQLQLGAGAVLRSGTVVYGGSTIGAGLTTGHHVIVREECRLGDRVSIWSNSVIDYGCVLGNDVKVHANCYVAQYTYLDDEVFLAPGVTVANDLYPGDERSATAMGGPVIGRGAQIGAGATLLPYVRIGAGAIIGAGAVVTRDIPPGMVAYGNPARVTGRVLDLQPVDARIPDDHPLIGPR